MSIEKQDWINEQSRMNRVIGVIDGRMMGLNEYAGDTKTDVVDFRKHFWDDVTVNFSDAGEAAETYRSIKQQAEVLSEKERSLRQMEKELAKLRRLKQTPYFGRIDFVEDGEGHAERIYIGMASLLDENDLHFLIYDWRAPISNLYYDYAPGTAKYETPGGSVSGIIELKRQYIVRDGSIHSMFDTGVTIGDELLQEVLGKQTDMQMKSIVATIQREQNRIIRDEQSRLLVVRGAAGSGKTSAALQRAAYLLYRNRETLRAEQIVLFSPNPLFNSYVSTVLPELGEENLQQTTYQEYIEYRLGRTLLVEDPFMQMEYSLSAMDEAGYGARMEGIGFKASAAFMQLIDTYVSFLGEEGMIFKDLKFRGEVLIAAERIKEQFYALDSAISIPNRIQLISEELLKQLKELARQQIKKRWVEEEVELLDKEEYVQAYQELRSKQQITEDTFNDFDVEAGLLAKKVVHEHFKPLRSLVKSLEWIDTTAVYMGLFADPARALPFASSGLPNSWATICAQTLERLRRFELACEDGTPYLYLKERLEGFQASNAVRHVFIDEAQDYSPFQFAFLKRLFPRSKMTALGDLNQAIFAHAATGAGFQSLYSLYDNERTETIVLTRTYRSTRQIVEFTRGMIAGGDEIEPFNREGADPTVTRALDETELTGKITARIKSLQDGGHRTIAVICKTAEESRNAYESLQAAGPLRLIEKGTTFFETGVAVIPSYLAKGVEFDAVIIYNASTTQYGRESERKLFYTSCTRAMHELHLYFIGEPSPFIRV